MPVFKKGNENSVCGHKEKGIEFKKSAIKMRNWMRRLTKGMLKKKKEKRLFLSLDDGKVMVSIR